MTPHHDAATAPHADTHEVLNQPPPLQDYDLFAADAALREAVAREGADWAVEGLHSLGRHLGSAATLHLGDLANAFPPVLHSHDRFGHRRDEVEFHPAYHEFMRLLVREGITGGPWAEPRPGAHVARAARFILFAQVECGTLCPATMTFAAAPVLRHAPDLAEEWLPRLLSPAYDARFMPAKEKAGVLIGMGLTEKQGGSDVRSNGTRAEPSDEGEGAYRLTGHKWFLSVPMSDAFLVLAQAPEGLTCFFLPRFTPDGRPNALHLMRLKDKMGNRSNATAEAEFAGAWARRIGAEGRGVATVLEMAHHTRLDCALGTTGLMRAAVAQAAHHALHRTAFQRRLIDQPLMTNVLADLAVEAEAATALSLRLARAFDTDDAAEVALRRLMTPAAKYWVCKRGAAVAVEAMEVLGGNGYVEDGPMPRIYREMPVNSIWEGSGNVMCLDVLRALARTPAAADALMAEMQAAQGGDRRLDRHMAALADSLARGPDEAQARRLTENIVLCVQGALLVRHAPAAVADAFCASRLGDGSGRAFGTLPGDVDAAVLAARAVPVAA